MVYAVFVLGESSVVTDRKRRRVEDDSSESDCGDRTNNGLLQSEIANCRMVKRRCRDLESRVKYLESEWMRKSIGYEDFI